MIWLFDAMVADLNIFRRGGATFAGIFLFLVIGISNPLAQSMPESDKSREAIARVTASLQRDAAAASHQWGSSVFIRVFKAESQLEIWLRGDERFHLFRTYAICSYSGQLGPKLKEGDRQAPEGFYFVAASKLNPNSSYHLSFDLGFPNTYDQAHGRTGSYLMVHGDCVSIGCFAMATSWLPLAPKRNQPIEEIWTLMAAAFQAGQPFVRVHVFPFRMTEENLTEHAQSEWIDFWRNLKEGYDFFEAGNLPPEVTVADKRYVFSMAE